MQNNNTYLLSNDTFIFNLQIFKSFSVKLLCNKLILETPITNDIGYLFNEYLQKKPSTVYEIEENGEESDWIGTQYMLWCEDNATWLYNRENDNIVLEITPNFPVKPIDWFRFSQKHFLKQK